MPAGITGWQRLRQEDLELETSLGFPTGKEMWKSDLLECIKDALSVAFYSCLSSTQPSLLLSQQHNPIKGRKRATGAWGGGQSREEEDEQSMTQEENATGRPTPFWHGTNFNDLITFEKDNVLLIYNAILKKYSKYSQWRIVLKSYRINAARLYLVN